MVELDVNEVLHAPVRLNIMAALSTIGEQDKVSYTRLRDILDLTPGNLTSHLRRLEAAGYVTQTKRFVKRVPVTEIKMTRKGRNEFETYVTALRTFVDTLGTQTTGRQVDGKDARN